jgi:hypothetical protein
MVLAKTLLPRVDMNAMILPGRAGSQWIRTRSQIEKRQPAQGTPSRKRVKYNSDFSQVTSAHREA